MKILTILLTISLGLLAGCQKEQKQIDHFSEKIQGNWKRTALHGSTTAEGVDTYSMTFSNGSFYYVKTHESTPVDGDQGSYTVSASGVIDLSNGFQFHFDHNGTLKQSGINYLYNYGDPNWTKQ